MAKVQGHAVLVEVLDSRRRLINDRNTVYLEEQAGWILALRPLPGKFHKVVPEPKLCERSID